MKNNYFRVILMACCLFVGSHLNAQFRFGDKPSIGQSQQIDTQTGIATFLLDFNTDQANSSWTQDTSINITFKKCQTNRGFQSEVFVSEDEGASTIFNDDFKVRRWNSNENAVHMASIDSLTAILAKWSEKYAGTADTAKNIIWKPSACLFDVDGDDTNQAFGTHPGQYKKVEYGFQFSFSGVAVTTDIVFEMFTYDAGNTGQTASYELQVAVGSESNIVANIPNYYVSGDPVKTVNLAADIGMNFADFSNQKVYIKLKTLGTGTPIAMDSFDPTVVFDNMSVSYQLPLWIDPAAGAMANAILDNSATPLVADYRDTVMTSMHLETVSRYGSLEITNDLQNPSIKNLTFLAEGALKANDGAGNYTVDVPYTFVPAVYDEFAGTWTKAKITVAAPTDGAVNDDLMLFFEATPTSTAPHFARIELNSGTRIWFDYYLQGNGTSGNLIYIGALGPDQPAINGSDSVSIIQLQNAGYTITLVDDNDVEAGYDYSAYDAVVFGESTSSSRVVAFGTIDQYPIPAVILEPLSVRTDKWGWVVNPDPGTFGNSDYPGFKEDRDCLAGTTEMKILDADHYITQDYTQDEIISWSSATCGDPEVIAAFGFNINQDMSGAIPLAKNNSEGISEANLWAIPTGTTVTGGTITTEHKMVIFGIHEFGLYGKDDDMTEYATPDFYNLLIRSVEWVLLEDEVEPLANLLYVSAVGPNAAAMNGSDSVSILQLEAAGYGITLIDDNDVASGGFDYSPYDAVIFGESCSSSNVVAFGNTDLYPAPCLMLEPLSVRTDKWGWVVNPDPGMFGNSDYPGFKQDNDCLEGTTELQILNNTHYITQDYTQDTVLSWSSATCGAPETIFAFGFNLNQDMSGGFGLVKNNSTGIINPNLWAIPAGTTVTGGTTTDYRTVVFGIHELGLYGKDDDMTEYATEDFYTLMLRSVEWILGAGDDSPSVIIGTNEPEVSQDILIYPNPATGQATLSFDLQNTSKANLYLVNMMGQRIEIFRNQEFFQGNNQVEIDLHHAAPGLYMFQLETEGKVFIGKLTITK